MQRCIVVDKFVSLHSYSCKRSFLLWRCFSLCKPWKLVYRPVVSNLYCTAIQAHSLRGGISPKFCCSQKNLSYNKNKNLAPIKTYCAPKKRKTGLCPLLVLYTDTVDASAVIKNKILCGEKWHRYSKMCIKVHFCRYCRKRRMPIEWSSIVLA